VHLQREVVQEQVAAAPNTFRVDVVRVPRQLSAVQCTCHACCDYLLQESFAWSSVMLIDWSIERFFWIFFDFMNF
jgi:hypothetical protein